MGWDEITAEGQAWWNVGGSGARTFVPAGLTVAYFARLLYMLDPRRRDRPLHFVSESDRASFVFVLGPTSPFPARVLECLCSKQLAYYRNFPCSASEEVLIYPPFLHPQGP